MSRWSRDFIMSIPLPRLRLLRAELHAFAGKAILHNFVSLLLEEWLHCGALDAFGQPDHNSCWLVKHGVFVGRSLQFGAGYCGE